MVKWYGFTYLTEIFSIKLFLEDVQMCPVKQEHNCWLHSNKMWRNFNNVLLIIRSTLGTH